MKDLADLKVVLASSSPRRHQLLELIGVAHEVRAADVDETYIPGEQPDSYAERLARAKAELVSVDNRGALLIGADTIVVVDGKVLGKPRDENDAARMLGMLSGRAHDVMTAVAVSHEGRTASAVEKVSVTFRDLSDEEITSYIATGEPMDKAGAYGIQGYGATIVRRIDGDFFAVMGLSLMRVVELMAQLGVRYGFPR
ncbi:MAG TPA: Maf family protein [Gemmatimonadaceae bacterium]